MKKILIRIEKDFFKNRKKILKNCCRAGIFFLVPPRGNERTGVGAFGGMGDGGRGVVLVQLYSYTHVRCLATEQNVVTRLILIRILKQNTVMRRDLTRFLLYKPSMFFLKNGI